MTTILSRSSMKCSARPENAWPSTSASLPTRWHACRETADRLKQRHGSGVSDELLRAFSQCGGSCASCTAAWRSTSEVISRASYSARSADLSATCWLIRSLSSARKRSTKEPQAAALPTATASHCASACTRLSQSTCDAPSLLVSSLALCFAKHTGNSQGV